MGGTLRVLEQAGGPNQMLIHLPPPTRRRPSAFVATGRLPRQPLQLPALLVLPAVPQESTEQLDISPHSPLVSTALDENGWVCGECARAAG